MFDKPTETGEGTACEARRTSTHSFKLRRVCVRMCRATDWEPQAMCCGAALRGGYRGIPPVLLFFCRRFLFQIKRKCRNAGSIYCLIIVGREGRGWIIQFHIVPLARHRCVEVAAPYKPRVNKFVQASRTDEIRLYRSLFHYSLLLITLSEAKQTPQSRLTPSQLPYRGAYKKSPDSYYCRDFFCIMLFYFTSSAVRKPFLTRRLFILSFGSRSLLTEVSWLRVSIT